MDSKDKGIPMSEYEIWGLTEQGCTQKTAKALITAGFTTYLSVAVTPAKEIQTLTTLSQELSEKVTGLAIRRISKYRTAHEYNEERKLTVQKLTTGSRMFDNILRGGFETKAITELSGPFAGGKTQLCYTTAVLVQRPAEEGGLDGAAIVIDTEGTFLPERLEEIAATRGLDVVEIMTNIHTSRAYNTRHLAELVRGLPEIIKNTGARLIIVDSMASHFRSEYIGRETLAPRQQRLGGILGNLLRVAESFNAVVLVTNQMQGNPSGYGGEKMALGNVMAHACTHRIKLRKGRSGTRIAKTVDSPNLPVQEAPFKVTEKGVVDVKEEEDD